MCLGNTHRNCKEETVCKDTFSSETRNLVKWWFEKMKRRIQSTMPWESKVISNRSSRNKTESKRQSAIERNCVYDIGRIIQGCNQQIEMFISPKQCSISTQGCSFQALRINERIAALCDISTESKWTVTTFQKLKLSVSQYTKG
jgi:hypothetical protein